MNSRFCSKLNRELHGPNSQNENSEGSQIMFQCIDCSIQSSEGGDRYDIHSQVLNPSYAEEKNTEILYDQIQQEQSLNLNTNSAHIYKPLMSTDVSSNDTSEMNVDTVQYNQKLIHLFQKGNKHSQYHGMPSDHIPSNTQIVQDFHQSIDPRNVSRSIASSINPKQENYEMSIMNNATDNQSFNHFRFSPSNLSSISIIPNSLNVDTVQWSIHSNKGLQGNNAIWEENHSNNPANNEQTSSISTFLHTSETSSIQENRDVFSTNSLNQGDFEVQASQIYFNSSSHRNNTSNHIYSSISSTNLFQFGENRSITIQMLHDIFMKLYRWEDCISVHPTLLYDLLSIIAFIGFHIQLPRLQCGVEYNQYSFQNVLNRVFALDQMRQEKCNSEPQQFQSLSNFMYDESSSEDSNLSQFNLVTRNNYHTDHQKHQKSTIRNPLEELFNEIQLSELEIVDIFPINENECLSEEIDYRMVDGEEDTDILADCYYYAARLLPSLPANELQHLNITAEFFFEKSAELGKLDALHRLGWIYTKKFQLQDAVDCYRKAIAFHHEGSMINLGWLYEHSTLNVENPDESDDILEGIPTLQPYSNYFPWRNIKMTIYYYYLAATRGSGIGWYNLGSTFKTYAFYQESISCYQNAIKRGYTSAYVSLGRMFETGRGIEQSSRKALQCYIQAAVKGDVDAIVNIGLMYQNGESSQQSLHRALQLFEYAVHLGDAEAEEYVDNVKKRIVNSCTCIGKM